MGIGVLLPMPLVALDPRHVDGPLLTSWLGEG